MGDAPLWFKLCFYAMVAWFLFVLVRILWDIIDFERGWGPRVPTAPKKGVAPGTAKRATAAGGAAGGIGVIGSYEPALGATHEPAASSVEMADMSYDSGGSDSGGGDSGGGDFSGGGGDYGGGGSGGSWS